MIYPAILSEFESKVYKHLTGGLQRIDIAMKLKLSYDDIYKYTCSIQTKLKLNNFTALLEYIKKNK